MNDRPAPPKRYSSEDLKMELIEKDNAHLRFSIDNLSATINAHQDHIKQLSITVENLSVKVGILSDITWKGGIGLIGLLFSLVVAYYFKK